MESQFLWWIIESIVYWLLWILMMALTYFFIEKITSFSIKKELVEDENIAIWIMFAGIFISVAIIIAAAIR